MNPIVIFTYWSESLGFAVRMKSEGERVIMAIMDYETAFGHTQKFKDEEEEREHEKEEERRLRAGDGLVEKMPVKDALRFVLRQGREHIYCIFDFNLGFTIADSLREKGYKVYGASKLGYKLENDRKFGMNFMKKYYHIDPPEEMEYGTGSVDKALQEVEKNEGKSYVVKPDEIVSTFLPRARDIESSREELIEFMLGNQDDLNQTPFILQEKIFGYEVASEVIFSHGIPIIANVDLETKRKYAAEQGPLCGCAGDMVFHQDMESRLVQLANEPFFRFAKKMNYTGPHDLNIIFKDKKRFYGLEFCGTRMGYNAIYTYLALIKIPVGEFFRGVMDGTIAENPESENFAASVTIFNENEKKENIGFKIKDEKNTWIVDAWKDEDKLKSAGVDERLVYVTSGGATPEEAWYNAYEETNEAIVFPNKYFRRDLDKIEYPNIIYRYYRLSEMGIFS